ncbi:hypothetical protein, partial [Streptomyces lavendulocolor]|uniref:hypothetical protein n=1 Tax=Streptomyces lavendulocolor TaxID=67316 RepID=UPI003C2C1284
MLRFFMPGSTASRARRHDRTPLERMSHVEALRTAAPDVTITRPGWSPAPDAAEVCCGEDFPRGGWVTVGNGRTVRDLRRENRTAVLQCLYFDGP